MNADDVLKYGHLWVFKYVDGLSEAECEVPGVCGIWSVKDIIAHLASFENLLVEVLGACLGQPGPTPILDQHNHENGDDFNANQVGQRKGWAYGKTLDEYRVQAEKSLELVARIPAETLRQPGTIPWYGMQYSLEDFIVYQYYGHKREHMAQVAVYRDGLKR
ncbi:MAG TPA: DinB family protein [Anaerolineales bacterium]